MNMREGVKTILWLTAEGDLSVQKSRQSQGGLLLRQPRQEGSQRRGAESYERLRMIIKKRPISFHALLSAYL